MDWVVHGVAKSWTQLSNFQFHFQAEKKKITTLSSMPLYILEMFVGLTGNEALLISRGREDRRTVFLNLFSGRFMLRC